jgi:hypothetical protein
VNWKRSFLRIWITLSLVWLVAATGLSFAMFSVSQEQIRKPTDVEIAECNKKRGGPWCNDSLVEKVRVWKIPPWPILLGIASVPILLLGSGAVIAWVIRGFKARS